MRFSPGIKTPAFLADDIYGKTQFPEKYMGQKWMLSFFRYASCPLCNFRVNQLIQHYDRWQTEGFNILAIFESSGESIKKYVGKQAVPFPIIPDPELDLYRKYHVESSWIKYILGAFTFIKAVFHGFIPGKMEGDKAIVPADFLINEDGTIHTAYYGNNIGDHIPIELINEFIHNY